MNSYDAAGRLRESVGDNTVLGRFEYDGDGVKTKSQIEAAYVFLLRSSVLGQTLEEINTTDGTRWNGFVFADGELIATQSMGLVYWQHRDPSQRSTRTTEANQEGVGHDELDPNGSKVDIPGGNHYNGGSGGGHILGSGGTQARLASLMDIRTCDFYGMAVPCSMKDLFQEHISSLDNLGQLQWKGKTTAQDYLVITFGDMKRIPGVIDFNHKGKKKKTITLPIGPPRTISISDLGRDKKDSGETEKELTPTQREEFEKVRKAALNALRSSDDCLNYVMGNSTDNPIDVIENMPISSFTYFNGVQFAAGEPYAIAAVRGCQRSRQNVEI